MFSDFEKVKTIYYAIEDHFENERRPFPIHFTVLRKIAKWNWEPSCNGTRLYNWKYQNLIRLCPSICKAGDSLNSI